MDVVGHARAATVLLGLDWPATPVQTAVQAPIRSLPDLILGMGVGEWVGVRVEVRKAESRELGGQVLRLVGVRDCVRE